MGTAAALVPIKEYPNPSGAEDMFEAKSRIPETTDLAVRLRQTILFQ